MGQSMGKLDPAFQLDNDAKTPVDLRIDYCGSWGYGAKANELANLVKQFYPLADVQLNKIPGYSGCFEVFVNGRLLHSKKAGDGYVKDPAEFLQKVKSAAENR